MNWNYWSDLAVSAGVVLAVLLAGVSVWEYRERRKESLEESDLARLERAATDTLKQEIIRMAKKR